MTTKLNFKKTICSVSKLDCVNENCEECPTYTNNLVLSDEIEIKRKIYKVNKNQTVMKGKTEDISILVNHFGIEITEKQISQPDNIDNYYPEWIETKKILQLNDPEYYIHEHTKPLIVAYENGEIYCIAPLIVLSSEECESKM